MRKLPRPAQRGPLAGWKGLRNDLGFGRFRDGGRAVRGCIIYDDDGREEPPNCTHDITNFPLLVSAGNGRDAICGPVHAYKLPVKTKRQKRLNLKSPNLSGL